MSVYEQWNPRPQVPEFVKGFICGVCLCAAAVVTAVIIALSW